jgi:hypothetical protein
MEIELEITPEELAQLWSEHEKLGLSKVERGGSQDVDVDGHSMGIDWGQPAWDPIKRAAVRKACLVNDAQNLPQIGRRVDSVVRQVGKVDIYFDDGSFVSATVRDPQPSTHEEAAVIERVYGVPTAPRSCGCKKASDELVKAASPVVDMVAAVRRNELLGAMDVRKSRARDPYMWSIRVGGPLELYVLNDVPMALARTLTDFPGRSSKLRNGRQAWALARQHADPRPFKRLLGS